MTQPRSGGSETEMEGIPVRGLSAFPLAFFRQVRPRLAGRKCLGVFAVRFMCSTFLQGYIPADTLGIG